MELSHTIYMMGENILGVKFKFNFLPHAMASFYYKISSGMRVGQMEREGCSAWGV